MIKIGIVVAALFAFVAADKTCNVCEDDCSVLECSNLDNAICVQDNCTCELSWELDGVDVTDDCVVESDIDIDDDDDTSDDDDDDGDNEKPWKARIKARVAWKIKKAVRAAKKANKGNKFALKKQMKQERRDMLIKKWRDMGLEAKATKFQDKWAKMDAKKEERKERWQQMTPEEREEWKSEKKAKKMMKKDKKGNAWKAKKLAKKQKRLERKQKRLEEIQSQ
ncbi:hypothetical protein ACF0H5_011658 [Mactra antiquata]